jgi:hypothetical protein
VSVGKVNEIIEHELPMGPDFVIKGKVFAGQAVGTTGSELSFQTLVPVRIAVSCTLTKLTRNFTLS